MTIKHPPLPAGTSGMVIEPWTPGETYGVAANWSQASAPVYTLGEDGWQASGRQVADFGHDDTEALVRELTDALIAFGEDPLEAADQATDLVENAEEVS